MNCLKLERHNKSDIISQNKIKIYLCEFNLLSCIISVKKFTPLIYYNY